MFNVFWLLRNVKRILKDSQYKQTLEHQLVVLDFKKFGSEIFLAGFLTVEQKTKLIRLADGSTK